MAKLLFVSLCLILSACLSQQTEESSSASSSDVSVGGLGVDFVDQSKLNQEQNMATSPTDPNLGGVYFGELEIVAYNYRPGESVQRWEPNNGFSGVDWSYWVLLQAGYDISRENVLKPGQRLDMSALNVQLNPPVDIDFIKEVGKFSVDFFEVAVYRPGVIYNNEFHFNGVLSNSNPLYKYPAWSAIPQYESHPGVGGFAGFYGHGSASDTTQRISDFSVLFARDDWFPEPVLVYFSNRTTIAGTSKTLSSAQSEVLTSLISQNTQRRSIDHLIIVPYSRQVVAMKKDRVGDGGARPSSQAQVSFNLSNILETGSTFAGVSSVIKFKRDANDVPLGITLTFKAK